MKGWSRRERSVIEATVVSAPPVVSNWRVKGYSTCDDSLDHLHCGRPLQLVVNNGREISRDEHVCARRRLRHLVRRDCFLSTRCTFSICTTCIRPKHSHTRLAVNQTTWYYWLNVFRFGRMSSSQSCSIPRAVTDFVAPVAGQSLPRRWSGIRHQSHAHATFQ